MKQGILITGGSGYLGHALAERLLADGCPRVCIYSRNEFSQAKMRAHFANDSRLRWFIGDVRDEARLARSMQSVESVIHAAALKRIEVGAYNPDEMVKTNVQGTINVISAARSAGVEKALLVSSDKAFEPVSPYGQTKALAESLFLTAGDPQVGPRFAVVRYGNVAGSTGSVIPTWRAQLEQPTRSVVVTDPECTRFWMSRAEAAELVLGTLRNMKGGELAIPDLPAFRLGDLALAMGAQATNELGLQKWEKLHESMDATRCSRDAPRLSVEDLRARLKEAA